MHFSSEVVNKYQLNYGSRDNELKYPKASFLKVGIEAVDPGFLGDGVDTCVKVRTDCLNFPGCASFPENLPFLVGFTNGLIVHCLVAASSRVVVSDLRYGSFRTVTAESNEVHSRSLNCSRVSSCELFPSAHRR